MVVSLIPVYLFTGKAAVTKAAEGTYEFKAKGLQAAESGDNIELDTSAKYGTSEYFSISGTVKKRVTKTDPYDGTIKSVETASAEGGSIEFTSEGEFTLTVNASSTGSKNYSVFVLADKSTGNVVEPDYTETLVKDTNVKSGVVRLYGTTPTDVTYSNVDPGTYVIKTPRTSSFLTNTSSDSNNDPATKRGVRIYSLKVVEQASNIQPVEWVNVANPVVTSAIQTSGKNEIVVKASSVFGKQGADKLTVYIKDGDTVIAQESITSAATNNEIKLTIPASTASKHFSVVVETERTGESTKKTTTLESGVDYLALFNAPVIDSINNKGNGNIEINFTTFEEATKYEIAYSLMGENSWTYVDVTATQQNGKATITIPSSGLNKSYDFKVRTSRNSESKESAKDTRYIKTEASNYKSKTIDITSGLKKGQTYGDNTYCTVEVLEDMEYKDDDSPTNPDYNKFVQGNNNPSPKEGAIPTTGAAFIFKPVADSKITITSKTATKTYHFICVEDGKVVSDLTDTSVPDKLSFKLSAGKTYYYYLDGSKAMIYAMKISTGTPDVDWENLANPSITNVEVNATDNTKVDVTYSAVLGDTGAEEIKIDMIDANGSIVQSFTTDVASKTMMEFTPEASGNYTFKATLSREGYTSKESTVYAFNGFVLPLAQPKLSLPKNNGDGSVTLSWGEVKEADSYKVEYKLKDAEAYTVAQVVTGLTATVKNLTLGQTYTFKVTPVRNETEGEKSSTADKKITDVSEFQWNFSAFGQGVTIDNDNITDKTKSMNGYSGSVYDGNGSVNVWSLKNKGKIVPASTDGLAFYYAQIPTSQNFTLTAKVTVNKWTYTNGQEGFGLMAADTVGTNGDPSVFWNNSYMASVTKVEYYSAKDEETGEASIGQSGDKISMKLGIGSQEKTGVTKDNLSKLQDNDSDAINNQFKSTMTTLESSQVAKDAGAYNIVGNYTNTDATFKGTTVAELETFKLTIRKNNTGYFVSYTDEQGNTTTKKYYDTEALSQLDSDYVYAGFFASRACDATFSDVSLTTIDPSQDDPAEERPIEYIDVKLSVPSAGTASSFDYTLKAKTNVDGHVVVTKGNEVVGEADVEAEVPFSFDTKLKAGSNKFVITLTPDESFVFGEYSKPTSYDVVEVTKTVTYAAFTGDLIYVSADATKAVDEAKANETYSQSSQINSGKGTKANPIDLYSAVSFAKAGQKILLLPGKYNIVNNVLIPFGIDGTADNNIYLMPAEEGTRVVLDFKGTLGEGVTLCGNYWTVQNIDVTNSANGKNGIHVCGSYNTLDAVNTYNNGNTGIQISRFSADQEKKDWPAYNTIKNCHSHNNADAGYEDADGFAAKLTCGKGNVFIGCVASNNADDGWDLFAKPETGAISRVMIINCIAYANGFLEDGTDAGNGNGFKMGGSSMTGGHVILNSVAFDNKAKGIDSNSCPDNIVISCTSFNNGGSNVALYTNDAKNTDYTAYGVLSYRTIYKDVADTLKPKGTQDSNKIYQATDYYWGSAAGSSKEASSVLSNDDFTSVTTKAEREELTASVTPLASQMTLLASIVPVKYSELPFTRNADGTLNLNGLLMLTEAGRQKVGQGVGADALDKTPVLTEEAQAILASNLDEDEMTRLLSASKSLSSETISRAGNEGALTGDTNNTFVWMILLFAALAVIFGVSVYSYKRREA